MLDERPSLSAPVVQPLDDRVLDPAGTVVVICIGVFALAGAWTLLSEILSR